jgi:5-methylcytosine-specific restriction endonuclease McrA
MLYQTPAISISAVSTLTSICGRAIVPVFLTRMFKLSILLIIQVMVTQSQDSKKAPRSLNGTGCCISSILKSRQGNHAKNPDGRLWDWMVQPLACDDRGGVTSCIIPLTIMDSEDDNRTIWLLFLTLRHTLGLWNNMSRRRIKKEWRKRQGWPIHCYQCGTKTRKGTEGVPGTMTLEHIIPEWLIFELELPELLFDLDNFTLLCATCNHAKGPDMPDHASLTPELLGKFYWSIDERNKRMTLAR